ncbi:GTPase domain-containing protein [Chitinivorax sp. B]|uniref:GTP-binding protein n=1 Tax=Chitinivorax sp. B TaxID=2502235 RepID=UPI0010F87B82|nr:GTPase domain-containing protein [Chitinivorax sp. B]
MAEYDEAARKLTVKLVYYGPALSGKTTNLTRLHDLLAPPSRGDMMMLETQHDRTLFFDLLPMGFRAPSGDLIKFKLYTVPGQVAHDSTRKAVLSRADGVVFVADSQTSQTLNNAQSFDNLADNLQRVGLDIETLPLVVQFNKRDLSQIVPEAELHARWSATPWPLSLASALQGEGVRETLAALMPAVFRQLDGQHALQAQFGVSVEQFVTFLMD